MTSSRIPPKALFQTVRHSFPVRALRATVLGQILLSGLSKIWNRKARRGVTALTAIIIALLSGEWAAQSVAIMAIIGIIIWTAIQLDNGGYGCQ